MFDWANAKIENYNHLLWHIDKLDEDLSYQLKLKQITSGTFLDIGAGHGTQSNFLQKMGFSVTATDINQHSLKYAKNIERSKNLN